MALQGFDYAWGYGSGLPAALVRAGAKFVVRYVGTSSKCIAAPEARALHAAGIAIGMVYETSGTTFKGGEAAGRQDGAAAAAAARSIGAPAGAPIWFAIDTDTADFASVRAYLHGCAAACGPYAAKLYAGFHVVEAVGGAGHWQTYAWSSGHVSSHAGLYQYHNGVTVGGVDMDACRTLPGGPTVVDGWLTYAAAPTPVPAPIPAPPVTPPKGPPVSVRTPVQRAQQESLHPTRSYFDQCLVFVRTCFGLAADGHEPTAYSAWLEAGGASGPNTHTKMAAPANVPVFFKGSGPAGHIALSAGHGMVWSSDIARRGKVDLTSDRHIEAAWGMRYLGWAEVLEGKRIIPHV